VVEFLHKKAGWNWWKAAELVGYVENHRGEVKHKQEKEHDNAVSER
jgi:hypothetical protein